MSSGRLTGTRIEWGELLYVASGSLDVVYRDKFWQVRTGQALWHSGSGLDSATVWEETRILRLAHSQAFFPGPRLFYGSPLLREVLIRLAEIGDLHDSYGLADALLRVARSEMDRPLAIPLTPRWPRPIWAHEAALVLRDIGPNEMSIDALAAQMQVGRRNFERRFLHETGLTPSDWRREARLIESLRLLSMGMRQDGLHQLAGFPNRSPFYQAFRTKFGMSPARFWREFSGTLS